MKQHKQTRKLNKRINQLSLMNGNIKNISRRNNIELTRYIIERKDYITQIFEADYAALNYPLYIDIFKYTTKQSEITSKEMCIMTKDSTEEIIELTNDTILFIADYNIKMLSNQIICSHLKDKEQLKNAFKSSMICIVLLAMCESRSDSNPYSVLSDEFVQHHSDRNINTISIHTAQKEDGTKQLIILSLYYLIIVKKNTESYIEYEVYDYTGERYGYDKDEDEELLSYEEALEIEADYKQKKRFPYMAALEKNLILLEMKRSDKFVKGSYREYKL